MSNSVYWKNERTISNICLPKLTSHAGIMCKTSSLNSIIQTYGSKQRLLNSPLQQSIFSPPHFQPSAHKHLIWHSQGCKNRTSLREDLCTILSGNISVALVFPGVKRPQSERLYIPTKRQMRRVTMIKCKFPFLLKIIHRKAIYICWYKVFHFHVAENIVAKKKGVLHLSCGKTKTSHSCIDIFLFYLLLQKLTKPAPKK